MRVTVRSILAALNVAVVLVVAIGVATKSPLATPLPYFFICLFALLAYCILRKGMAPAFLGMIAGWGGAVGTAIGAWLYGIVGRASDMPELLFELAVLAAASAVALTIRFFASD